MLGNDRSKRVRQLYKAAGIIAHIVEDKLSWEDVAEANDLLLVHDKIMAVAERLNQKDSPNTGVKPGDGTPKPEG